ncbi:MAG: arginine--tRNA ligase, partial [Candidatus Nanoarchaeia archaeon]
DFTPDSSIYVVGADQKYHFDTLFKILKELGFYEDLHHMAYGMVRLPEGKMKSREGRVVLADDLIDKTAELAEVEVEKRHKLTKQALRERSRKIAVAAIKYKLLKMNMNRDMIFNPEEEIDFEGDTGPYLLYSYARAASILNKVKRRKQVKIVDLNPEEVRLIKKIAEFYDVVDKASKLLAPNLLANYTYELAKSFNEFYHAHQVINSKEEGFRLQLVKSFKRMIGRCLSMLGIDVIEEM